MAGSVYVDLNLPASGIYLQAGLYQLASQRKNYIDKRGQQRYTDENEH